MTTHGAIGAGEHLRLAVARHRLAAGLVASAAVVVVFLAIVLIVVGASIATVVAVMAAFVAAYFGAAQLWITDVIGDAQNKVAVAAANAAAVRANELESRRKDPGTSV